METTVYKHPKYMHTHAISMCACVQSNESEWLSKSGESTRSPGLGLHMTVNA